MNPVGKFLGEKFGLQAVGPLRRRGGKKRVEKMTAEQLSEAGRKAVQARWKKVHKKS